jgi:hypothetical protein
LERLKKAMDTPQSRPLPALKSKPHANALATPEGLAALIEAIIAQVTQKLLPPAQETHTAPTVPITRKLTLSVKESAALPAQALDRALVNAPFAVAVRPRCAND